MRPQPGVPPVGPGFMPATGPLGRLRDALVGRLGASMWKKGLPAYNRARSKFGLAPLDDIWSQYDRLAGVCMLTAECFDFASTAPSPNQRYLGPVLDDPVWAHDITWTPPWPASNTDPLVLVGLSSTYQHQQAALTNVVAAVAGMPVRALVTLGPSLAPDVVTSLSPNVAIVPTAPHSLVLPQCAAAITHCGHGTTMRALTNGVPLVCMPMGRDQNDTAARVAHHGAGVRLKPTARPAAIRRALEAVLREPSYRSAAQRLRDRIADEARRVDPVAVLEELVPGARKVSVSRAS
jgi:UDP:flavonoid glycosyltransferase YjiC (YdhE family)